MQSPIKNWIPDLVSEFNEVNFINKVKLIYNLQKNK